MRRYGYFAIFRIFTTVMMPIVAAGVLFLRMVGVHGILIHFVFGMLIIGVIFSWILFFMFKRIFEAEIDGREDIHPLYLSKMEEFRLLSSVYQKESAALREDIQRVRLKSEEQLKLKRSLDAKAENLRKKSLSFYNNIEKLFELTSENLAMIDQSGKICKVNRNMIEYLGYNPTDHEVQTIFEDRTYSDRVMLEKISNAKQLARGVVTQRFRDHSSKVWVTKTRIGEQLFLLRCKPIEEDIIGKAASLVQNREIDYINKINLSLTINKGTNEMLSNIAHSVKDLFRINNIAVLREENGEWSVMQSEGSCQTEKLFGVLAAYDDEQMQITGCEDGKHVVIIKLYSAPQERIVMLLATDHGISSDDLIIIRMFANQATIVIQRSKSYEQLKKLFFNTVISLVDVIEAKDKYTEGHSMRVAFYAVELAKKIGMSEDDIEKIEIAGVLHDVGKVSISQEILQKKGKLTPEEFEAIKTHPWNGYKIIENIDFDEHIKQGVAYHHVRYDLGGYPENHGLKELPEFAALIAIADAFDAMTSKRSYSTEKTMAQAIDELIRGRGTHFSPHMVDVMVELCQERDLLSEAHRINPNEKGTFSGMRARALEMDDEAWKKVGVYESR